MSEREEETLPPCRVLVADDNHDAADTLALLLELDGHEVRTAYDGHSALALAETFRPAVGLLDIGMPGLDGYRLAAALRERLGSGPVLVAMTGWGQDDDKRRATEAGFDHHMIKPVDPDLLSRTLAALRRGRPPPAFAA